MKKSIFTIFVLSVLTFAGCSSATETTNTAVNAPANAPADSVAETKPEIDVNAPFVPSADPKDDLLNSTRRLQSYDAWAATLENDAMPEMKTELEYVRPDRYRIVNPVGEIVVVGSNAYAKEGGEWEKLPEDIGAQINEMKKNFNAEGMDAIKEVKKIGTEKIGGRDATIYTYSIEEDADTVKNSTKVWIANDNGLPLKIEVETENAGKKQKVTTTYNYTKQVKIEAPEINQAP